MFSDERAGDYLSNQYKYVEYFTNWRHNGLIEKKALELHEKYNFKYIIATSESDIERAAQLREYLNIDGQNVESAIAFRNKVVMKDILLKAGIRVPKYKKVENPLDLVGFVKENGYPIILKPINGAGAEETFLIQNENSLEDALKNTGFREFEVEEFIEGDVYHIDGIWDGNDFLFVVASKYINSLINFRDDSIIGSFILPEGNLSEQLIRYTKEVLIALPTNSTIGFHCELFLTPKKEIVLCEIASRVGGAKVVKMIESMYGFNLQEKTLHSQINKYFDIQKTIKNKRNYEIVGFLLLLSREGFLVDIPRKLPSKKIIEYNLNLKNNRQYNSPKRVIDSIASVVLYGDNEEEFLKEIKEIKNYFENMTLWKEG
ncbi:ATP-grasp domain-containing protein [Lysinibacillus halotolerans]|uniref:ATP-grasp domain-containing protein n=1 Tax=Lysinibacillus halotolerans TaxID=1368476 RepID=A0A3M8H463_9BACI|nr:ATP-grasp domain-containing protein [Lysinibacillus halotolerans]RNC97246.1 ATP-grasp domain-containing protein [Lysinibacillus halotolerans]